MGYLFSWSNAYYILSSFRFLGCFGIGTSTKSKFDWLFWGDRPLEFCLYGWTLYKLALHECAMILLESTDMLNKAFGDLMGGKSDWLWSLSSNLVSIYSCSLLIWFTMDSKSATLSVFFGSKTDPE